MANAFGRVSVSSRQAGDPGRTHSAPTAVGNSLCDHVYPAVPVCLLTALEIVVARRSASPIRWYAGEH